MQSNDRVMMMMVTMMKRNEKKEEEEGEGDNRRFHCYDASYWYHSRYISDLGSAEQKLK